mmetsp:Transcript_17300/g.20803  ORF Transcript_17300/g.20803 Transcript_17300/m.20803 type:complete len:481 (-) Transcript_17300:89-1531(-)|eukprot:CAMPEP_0204834832 /NCGR_PEP_ID=MMETSP1346-20131115/20872_1 /ASSEMBLY_ACC=CAM_ASM_000771 /TAXON_ID=215587 /ORGANISM="Aplanochytrium stocchinoi, Strain GSBS06" /LENGTH=480 /DNA_ID=CAMNT_0051968377 /DNA_START=410 /DNA_END=1852 /DNA_ORIENTATION=+
MDAEGFGEFDLLLPSQVLDQDGLFLEEALQAEDLNESDDNGDSEEFLNVTDDNGNEKKGKGSKSKPVKFEKSKSASGTKRPAQKPAASSEGTAEVVDAKKLKRRKQIAAASRASRARRKRELEDLREENKRLREERSQFLSKIGELQMKVENMRERGSLDMRVENELLRAQLMEHKRFVSCFKHLCDGAPTTINARHIIYKQGSDSAQAHVLGLISQSVADNWVEATIPAEAEIPYQNFSMRYKFKADYGENPTTSMENGMLMPSMSNSKVRQRLNVRIDLTYPGLDTATVSDFLWSSMSDTSVQQRLYNIKGIELTQLADDMPDKDTKMVYYREKWDAPKKDQDWVMICNRRRRDLPKSTLTVPCKDTKSKSKQGIGKVNSVVLALQTTQHSVAPQFHNANRITSMFAQGAVTWNVGGDARLCVVFSFPDDFKIKAVEGFQEVIHPDGTLTLKFAEVLKEFNQMLDEHQGGGVKPSPDL